jgi:hypothetical protein
MPERRSAIVSALIVDRPLCITCIATKAGMTENDVEEVLASIASRARLFRAPAARCEACGAAGPVVSLSRPA